MNIKIPLDLSYGIHRKAVFECLIYNKRLKAVFMDSNILSTAAQSRSNLIVTVAGATDGDAVSLGKCCQYGDCKI